MDASTSTTRSDISANLRRLHQETEVQQELETARREAQRQQTRSLVRLMQLDTRNNAQIGLHAENAALFNQRAAVQEQIQVLQDRFQAEKKRLPAMQDKQERHERLQRAKTVRDRGLARLRQHLAQMEAGSSSCGNSSRAAAAPGIESLLEVNSTDKKTKRVSATEFKQLMDQIRAVKHERKTMLDPYVANLKLAKLWGRLNNTERCLENYRAACQMMKEKEIERVPPEMMEEVLEKQRLRRRTALHYLFARALQRNQRQEAADLISRFIALVLPEDRMKDLVYVDRILREQEYIEEPTLASPDEITSAIRTTNSLGHLTDLRFALLKELLSASPTDPYLIESVAHMHVRIGKFASAEELTARFVTLPPVKQVSLFATFAELRYGI